MNALSIAAIVFACCFGAGLTGLFLHRVVPDQHLDPDSKDTVKLVSSPRVGLHDRGVDPRRH